MYAMGIPGGMLIDSKGPRWGVLVGTICLACGYFPLKRAYDQGAGSMSVPALCFFGLLTGLGSCTAFSASIKVCATNWPRHRGTATAFPLSAFGLSAFFYTFIAALVFPDDTSGYLLLLAIGTSVMTFVGMLFLRLIPPLQGSYQTVPNADERTGVYKRNDDSTKMHRTNSGTRAALKNKAYITNEIGSAEETSSLVNSSSSSVSGPGDIDAPSRSTHVHHPQQADITGWALLKNSKFWQLFILLALLCGVGLMSINNIGNNARSLWHHYDDTASPEFIQSRQLMHVSILSVCSFLGRLMSGIGSDWLIHHNASRFWTLVASSILFVLAQVVALILEDPNYLFWLSGLTGLAYGVLFGVYPALVADAFGPSGMGINWGAMTMAPVISGNVFNLCYGAILDHHSVFKGTPGKGGERVCDDGRKCYAAAYWVTLVASSVAVVWTLICIGQEQREAKRHRREGGERREHDV